jgi:uncharacterized protein
MSARAPHFDYWLAAPKDWRFHLKAKNGEIIAHGEGYKTKRGLMKAIDTVRAAAMTAELREVEAS